MPRLSGRPPIGALSLFTLLLVGCAAGAEPVALTSCPEDDASCAPPLEPPADACAAAAARVSECLGEEVVADDTCDPAVAQRVAAQPCSQISADGGKADGGPSLWCRLFPSWCHTVCDDARVYYLNCGIGIVSDDVPCTEHQAASARLVMQQDCATFCGVGRPDPCPGPPQDVRDALCDVGFWLVCLAPHGPPPTP